MKQFAETNLLAAIRSAEQYALANHVPIVSQAGAAVLTELVGVRHPERILEIGTAIGYSTMIIAAAMPAEAAIITIEKDPNRSAIAQNFIAEAGISSRVQLCCGDAGQLLHEVSGPFDFVFIDAAKGQYLDYLLTIKDKLSAQAVVVADNVLFRGFVENTDNAPRRYRTIVKRLREYLKFVNESSDFHTELHRTGDGIAVSYYLVNSL
ncbi:MAG: putative O-methyltransferase [Firmicutes bacterium]|nr:putative O-methyltransferase [Bacillota bacterium]